MRLPSQRQHEGHQRAARTARRRGGAASHEGLRSGTAGGSGPLPPLRAAEVGGCGQSPTPLRAPHSPPRPVPSPPSPPGAVPGAARGGRQRRAEPGRAAAERRERRGSHGPGGAVAQPLGQPAGRGRCLRGGRAAPRALLRRCRCAAGGAHGAAGAGHGAGQCPGHPGLRGGPESPQPRQLLLPQPGHRRPAGG